ncbi:hypothetical protein KY284_030098 [Solanum tuberosum]|nr:hypothetical protein KY284_030098 [Solanum tuberosum]
MITFDVVYILKFPHVFKVFEHPVKRILYSRLTRKSLLQIEQAKLALLAQFPQAITCLLKLLLLSNAGRLRLEHVRIARKDFGLPDDFEFSVVLKYPKYFRLSDAKETRNKYIEAIAKGRDSTPSELHLQVHTHGHDEKSFVGERARIVHPNTHMTPVIPTPTNIDEANASVSE